MKILLIVVITAVIIGAYLLFANFRGLFPFGGGGAGEGAVAGEISEYIQPPEPDEPIEPPPVLLIEIREDRIYHDGNEVTPEALEEILSNHARPEDIWELHDTHRAHRETFENVREILRRLDVVFRER